MSGGYFDYKDHYINDIADKIQHLIDTNEDETLNVYGERNGRFLKPKMIERFREAVLVLRIAAVAVHRIDWYISEDDGEETFFEQWDEEIENI